MSAIEDIVRAYLAASNGDTGRALRSAVADLERIAGRVSCGYVRGGLPLFGTKRAEPNDTDRRRRSE
jgi:hypothetical protein